MANNVNSIMRILQYCGYIVLMDKFDLSKEDTEYFAACFNETFGAYMKGNLKTKELISYSVKNGWSSRDWVNGISFVNKRQLYLMVNGFDHKDLSNRNIAEISNFVSAYCAIYYSMVGVLMKEMYGCTDDDVKEFGKHLRNYIEMQTTPQPKSHKMYVTNKDIVECLMEDYSIDITKICYVA